MMLILNKDKHLYLYRVLLMTILIVTDAQTR